MESINLLFLVQACIKPCLIYNLRFRLESALHLSDFYLDSIPDMFVS